VLEAEVYPNHMLAYPAKIHEHVIGILLKRNEAIRVPFSLKRICSLQPSVYLSQTAMIRSSYLLKREALNIKTCQESMLFHRTWRQKETDGFLPTHLACFFALTMPSSTIRGYSLPSLLTLCLRVC
jgi:hypothetical protein